MIRLGPFELHALVGRGGMAEVWRGIHVGQGVPVAIKVITARRAREAQFLQAFRNEVQAVARLHHPGIVLVLDHGEASPQAEHESEGRIVAGSPYLAMELATWGSLDRVKLPLKWEDILRILLGLLDALAHAHARGVIHRDLKPGNILLASPSDLRPGIKLTDFGIAHALEHETRPGKEEASSGTPHFMSPEQFLGQWRDYGPWTDLYAVGCIAHSLASGNLPFVGETPLQLAWAHINQPPPRLVTDVLLPDRFESWLRRLLEKDLRQRFQRAADAGWALMMIAEAHRKKHPELPAPETWVFEPTFKQLESKDALYKYGSRSSNPASSATAGIPAPSQSADTSIEQLGSVKDRPAIDPDAFAATYVRDQTSAVDQTFVSEPATELDPRTAREQRLPIDAEKLATLVNAQPIAATLPWADVMANLSRLTSSQKLDTMSLDGIPEPLLHPRRIPPLPRSWRRTTSPGPSMQLVGAGLGLYGLRAIPMVDRETERDAIWQALRHVRDKKSARLVLLHGAAGNGKSRLVEWISQRADEVGSGIVLRATHGPTPTPHDGLARMLARFLRCVDLPRPEAHARTTQILRAQGVTNKDEWDTLTELMFPSMSGPEHPTGSVIRFGSATERHVTIRRFLERLAAERPVIVWIDDVQWASDALAFATHALKMQRDTPSSILLLLTARDEALADRPIEMQMIDELMRLDAASRLHVPPLSAVDQVKFVEELLFLERDLAKQVAERSGGNPLFAVQLVGDWVSRGVLEVTPSGFVLQRGERAVLPDDIHQIWTMRIQRLLAHQPVDAQIALEIAAVLGRDVDSGEWEAACRAANIEFVPRLIDALIHNRLAQHVDGGWTFAHGMLRESLERRALDEGRYELHHRAAAKMLHQRYGLESPGIAERLGVHHLSAGDLDQALEPLLKGSEERIATSEFDEARAILERRESALKSLRAGEEDARWGEGWVQRARVAILQGRYQDAQTFAGMAERQARRWGWRLILPDALFELATTAYETGDQPRALDLYQKASELYRWNGDELGIARCQLGTSDAIYRQGDLARSYDQYKAALDLFERLGDAMGMSQCLWGMGYVAMWKNELDAALALFERQLRLTEGTGNRFRTARCVSSLGEVARQALKLEEAELYYRRALQIDESIGSNSVWVDHMNLALCLLAKNEFGGAHDELKIVLDLLKDGAVPAQLCAVHTEILPSLAFEEDWEAFDRHLAEGTRLLEETGLKDGDIAWTLQLAGDRAMVHGDQARAAAVYRLALVQWEALARPDKAEETRQALERARVH
jgi:serine/threonine protein kinase/tetratricopeptide (TPR) repeat protein